MRWSVLGVLALAAACGTPVRMGGHVAADARVYLGSNRYPRQAGGSGGSFRLEPEISLQDDSRSHTLTARPFLRVDFFDPNRTHFDLRRGDYLFAEGDVEVGVGYGIFSQGVLEGLRLVDDLNQRDLVEDIDGSEKLGQPYARLGLTSGEWTFRLSYLPYFRERTFPGVRGRLRSPLVVDTTAPVYESSLRAFHPNVAAQAMFNGSGVDLGIMLFSGTAREPRFIAQLSDNDVVPGYDLLQQASFDLAVTLDGLILKLEGAARLYTAGFLEGEWHPSFALAGGLEYTFYDVAGSGADLTFAVEYRYDYRPPRSPFTFLQNDAFAGARLAFNDDDGTEIRAGAITDVITGYTFAQVRAQRRLLENLQLQLEGRFFAGPEGVLESAFLRDSYLQARLAYFF
ncbi:MAG: hypothetical protein AB7S26_16135 [Sandaracinaceae bacterium]